jgi:hypothetical protein
VTQDLEKEEKYLEPKDRERRRWWDYKKPVMG